MDMLISTDLTMKGGAQGFTLCQMLCVWRELIIQVRKLSILRKQIGMSLLFWLTVSLKVYERLPMRYGQRVPMIFFVI